MAASAEEIFQVTGASYCTAKVGRECRASAGTIVYVELTTKQQNRVYRLDAIELSAKRVSLMDQIGEQMALHAYVIVQGESGQRVAHQVGLLDVADVEALIQRRD